MFYEKKVDRRSKSEMARFLAGHNRYDTARPWNRLTSYSNRAKIHQLGLTREQEGAAYEVLGTDYWDELSPIVEDFRNEMGGCYTVGVNGRSCGHLVLYRGEFYDPGHKSHCRACGQLNYRLVNGDVGQCGKCRKMERVNLPHPLRWHKTSSASIDGEMGLEDFMDLSMAELRGKVELVTRFDRACDGIRAGFIRILEEFEVVEETVMVPKTVKLLREAA